MTDLAPLRTPSLSELAYRSIKASILTGGFKMGERLNETQFAKSLEVSRGTVREALLRLCEEGIAVDAPRAGVTVRVFDWSDVIDIYNVRIGLETTAVRLAIRRGADIDGLEELVEEMRQAAESDDLESVSEAELGFHLELCQMSGNDHLIETFNGLAGRIQLALTLDINPDYEMIAERHEPVLQALREGDETNAVRVIQAHITGHLTEMLLRQGKDPGDLLLPLA